MKRTALLFTMIMVLVMIFSLSSCSIDATHIQGTFLEGTFVEDTLVENYTINFLVNGQLTSVTCKKGIVPTAPAVEGYETDNKSYAFTGWDKPIVAATEDTTYTAVFAATTKLFDVTFVYGQASSDTVKLHWGAEPKAPTKGLDYKTADKVYTFTGWDKTIIPVNGDVVYTAQYEESAREYNVYFVYGDGTYDVVKVAYGTVPTAPAEVPAIETTEKVYTFKGWDNELVAVTGEAEYYATYDEAARKYTLTFVYDGKTETKDYEYGATVTLPTPKASYTDATGSYIFKGWDKEPAAVTGEATYTATYEQIAKVLYVQDFDDKDFDRNSAAARYNEVLDSTWTLNLMAGGAYAKTVVDPNNFTNKYVVAGLLADNNKGTAQFNAKDASKKSGEGSLASMGDLTKLTFSIDLAAVEGVALPKGYIRFRGSSNQLFFAHNRDDSNRGDEIAFNGVVIDDVAITTTMQTFTFEFDFEACTATLLVDGVQKYTGALAITDGKAYIASCKEYLFNWAFETTAGESAICIDNLYIVAHK